jgi:hypothetical protein
MVRILVAYTVMAAFPLAARADDAPPRTIIALNVQAMPAPKPALRYTFLPPLQAMNPGNPVQEYLKCFSEQVNFFYLLPYVENRAKWLAMPLKDLPLKELHNYGGNALRQADYAARLDTPDWQVLLRLKSEGVRLQLPELIQLRELAEALRLRMRAEIAERRFDDALRTEQTLLALGRHMGMHPTLLFGLVSLNITSRSIATLDEMVQQPGCPNLYWALTDLPSPFIDLRAGMQSSRMIDLAEFAPFDL